MATETLDAPTDELHAFAKKHADALFDVVALLLAAAERVENTVSPMADDPGHQTSRIIMMAKRKVEEVAGELFDAA